MKSKNECTCLRVLSTIDENSSNLSDLVDEEEATPENTTKVFTDLIKLIPITKHWYPTHQKVARAANSI